MKRHRLALTVIVAAIVLSWTPATNATTHFKVFQGLGVGPIPDGSGSCPNSPGAPLNVTFNVSGLTGTVTAVRVTIAGSHTWVGDLDVVLNAPNATAARVFGKTGVYSGSNSCGDSSNLNGVYAFYDSIQNQPGGGWWQEANLLADGGTIPSGVYRATAAGTAGGPNPAPLTQLDGVFAGVAPNGTWTLQFVDYGTTDTGTITGAALQIATTTSGGSRIVDFDGDNVTDINVVRPLGSWYSLNSHGFSATTWGDRSTDTFISGDFDGDGKSDPAIWRPGSPGVFWVQKSSGGIMTQPWGLTGDDATVVGDYDGDGKTDFAVYRCPPGPTAGACYYYVLRSSDSSLLSLQWGFGIIGDYFPAPGDYDGDGRMDFAVQTANPSTPSQAVFYLMQSTSGYRAVPWGLASDIVVPGDYDGDGKTDIMVRRTVGGNRQYWGIRSSDSGTIFAQWGITNDDSTPGDYDGDGMTDFAVWRDSTTPGQSAFYIRRSTDLSLQVVQWGQHLDLPVAIFQVH